MRREVKLLLLSDRDHILFYFIIFYYFHISFFAVDVSSYDLEWSSFSII